MAAVQWAGDLASDIGVPLVLAHVVEPVVVSPLWLPLIADLDSEHVASAQRTLARCSANVRNTHTDYVVSVGPPADTIASLAIEHGAGLVVLGLANGEDSEGRKPGSVAYRVLRIAHAAVVVVPTPLQAEADGPVASAARQPVEHLARE
jgi:nucleotide-binding universal stress UspA family protein